MKSSWLKLGTIIFMLIACPLAVSADDAVGLLSSIVQPAGPKPGKPGKTQFDVVGRDYLDSASFGVIEFDASDLALGRVRGVKRLEVHLTQTIQPYSFEGMLRFCIFLDNTISLSADNPEIFFITSDMMGLGDTQGSGGYARYEMDDFEYMPGTTGDVDTFTFDIPAGSHIERLLQRQVNTGGVIRICVCPMEMAGNEDVAATYAGASHPNPNYRPALTIVPR